jgi:hypothetical protein
MTTVMNNKNNLKMLLGVLDTIHDFHKLDNHFGYNLLDRFIDFCLLLEPDINVFPEYEHVFNKINLKEVDKTDYKKKFYRFIIDKIHINNDNVSNINQTIISNFKIIFNIFLDGSYLYDKLTTIEILKIRIPLYYLVDALLKNNLSLFRKILKFLLNFMNVDYTDDLNKQIKNNCSRITNNITYPITFFDDMGKGLNKTHLVFKILNKDKLLIDQANVEGKTSYFERKEKVLYLDNENNALGFKIKEKDNVITFLDSQYFVKNNSIYSVLDDIKLKIKVNKVGRMNRAADSFGIYQTANQLVLISREVFRLYNNADGNTQTYIQEQVNNSIDIINAFEEYINNIKLILERVASKNYNIYILLSQLDMNNFFTNDFQNFYDTIVLIKNTIFNMKNYLLSNNLLTLAEYNIIQNLNEKAQMYFIYRLSRLSNIYMRGKITSQGIKALFIIKLQNNTHLDKIQNIIEIFNLDVMLSKIFVRYYNSSNSYNIEGCVTFLLFGAKRFGDWVQASLGKQHYFFVQTDDFYCLFRSLLIGGPVMIDLEKTNDDDNTLIYNYKNIPEFNDDYIYDYFINIKDSSSIDNINNHSILYTKNRRLVPTHNVSRNYFYKYIKYKTKYNQLKVNYKKID